MVNFFEEQGVLTCTFGEQMNTAACTEVEAELFDHIDNHTGMIVFDLKDVVYVASSFLRLCIASVKKVGSDRFNVVNVSKTPKKF